MTLSIGPIQRYIPDSTWFDLTQYSSVSTQDRVSISLADSNLWLINSSAPDLSYDYAPRIALLTDDSGYLSPIAATIANSTTGDITSFQSFRDILPTSNGPLGLRNWLGSSQFSAGSLLGSSTSASGSPSALSGDSVSGSTSSLSLASFASPSANTLSSSIGSQTLFGSGGDSSLIADGGTLPGNSSLGQLPGINLEGAQEAPFEMHSAVGLLVVGALVVGRRITWRKQTLSQS